MSVAPSVSGSARPKGFLSASLLTGYNFDFHTGAQQIPAFFRREHELLPTLFTTTYIHTVYICVNSTFLYSFTVTMAKISLRLQSFTSCVRGFHICFFFFGNYAPLPSYQLCVHQVSPIRVSTIVLHQQRCNCQLNYPYIDPRWPLSVSRADFGSRFFKRCKWNFYNSQKVKPQNVGNRLPLGLLLQTDFYLFFIFVMFYYEFSWSRRPFPF